MIVVVVAVVAVVVVVVVAVVSDTTFDSVYVHNCESVQRSH